MATWASSSGESRPRAVDAAEIAWIALIPCAIVAVVAILLVGPPLGHALHGHPSDELWPPGWWETVGQPEPVKEGRYLLSVAAPLLLVMAVLLGTRRQLVLPSRTVRWIAAASQVAVLAFVTVALMEQHPIIRPGLPAKPSFGLDAVAAGAALVAIGVVALRRQAVAMRIAALMRETTTRRRILAAAAVAFVAIWLLKSIMTDRLTGDVVGLNLPYTLNDALAVLDGRTPLVEYHVIYAKLLPYLTALVLGTFGGTVFVYTSFMFVLNMLALLAVYAVFRMVTRSSVAALCLLVPFVATSDLDCVKIAAGAVSPMALSAVWPMRFLGAYLLAWLTARHVAGRRPRQAWAIFLVAGVVTVNNLEFGVAATGATFAALLYAQRPASACAALRLAVRAAAGGLAAVVLVSLLTLVRAGELPSLGMLLEWPRIFTTLGWFAVPLRTWDLHLAIYATFVGAIVVAVVRRLRLGSDDLLTSMLMWSGVFGLLVGSYFVGRPDLLKVQVMLSAWSFALALLVVVCVRALVERDWRRPTLPQLLVLFGFGMSAWSLRAISLPQEQIARLTASGPEPTYPALAKRVVGERTRRGEKVAILLPMSFRISHELGLVNRAPYGLMDAIVTRSQMRTLLDALRRERVRKVFVPAPQSKLMQEGDTAPEQLDALAAIGFQPHDLEAGILELTRD